MDAAAKHEIKKQNLIAAQVAEVLTWPNPRLSPVPPRLPIRSHRRCETRPSACLDLDFHPSISTIGQGTRRTSGSRSWMTI
jgi:hypothetical protein